MWPGGDGVVRADIALKALLSFQIFVDNFVHADLHPGNILVQGADGLSKGQEARLQHVDVCDTLVVAATPARCPLCLVLLDAGIVAKLQAADLRNFRAVFTAVAMGQVRPARPSGVGPKSFTLLGTSGVLSLSLW